MATLHPFIIFLDFDGPTISPRATSAMEDFGVPIAQFDPVAVQYFNTRHYQCPLRFVIVSTHLRHYPTREKMGEYLKRQGLNVPLHREWRILNRINRGQGVFGWLNMHKHVKASGRWLICEDSVSDYQPFSTLMPNLVRADPENGILLQQMDEMDERIGYDFQIPKSHQFIPLS